MSREPPQDRRSTWPSRRPAAAGPRPAPAAVSGAQLAPDLPRGRVSDRSTDSGCGRSRSVAVIDDHHRLRQLIRTLVERHAGFEVVAEGRDGHDAVAIARHHRPDIVIVDNQMPGMTGTEAIPHVRRASPSTRIILYTMDPPPPTGDRAVADAYLSKAAPADQLIALLHSVPLP